ncbi:hypothetical protein [Fontivita pretiosa]|uniref:hypothetical protein n=1 Tax=Fontivita pretiosa TaxID=2989684 RepID=UPI003D168446
MTRERRWPGQTKGGFVLLSALAVVAIVAVAIVVSASAATTAGQRLSRQIADAQLDQLLLAGSVEAWHILSTTPAPAAGQTHGVNLPPPLADAAARVRVTIVDVQPDAATVAVVARLNEQSGTQTLHFARQAHRWRLTSARRDPA